MVKVRNSQNWFWIGLATSVLIVFGLSGCESKKEVHPTPGPRVSPVELSIVHGPEIEGLVTEVKRELLKKHPALGDGSPIKLDLISHQGLKAAELIASGEVKAQAWIAPSTSLVNYANSRLRNLGAKQVDCLLLFSTPVVVATQARHRAYFNTQGQLFSWSELIETSFAQHETDSDEPFYLAFNHGVPGRSVTGLASLIQLSYLSQFTKDKSLNLRVVKSDHSNQTLKRFQYLVSNYGLDDHALLNRSAIEETRRVRFTLTTEQQMALFNLNRETQEEHAKLMALYPREGSYWQDYQLCRSEADWVSPAQSAALRFLYKIISEPKIQDEALRLGFRPASGDAVETPPLTAKHGVALNLPNNSFWPVSGSVVDYLLSNWNEVRRAAAVMVVMDTSGSTSGEPIKEAKAQIRNLLAALGPEDLQGLVTFGSTPVVQSPFTTDTKAVIELVDRARPLGGSAVYDGLKSAVDVVTSSKTGRYRRAVVVITDGEDSNSQIRTPLLHDILRDKFTRHDILLIIIGFHTGDKDFSDLKKIAEAANGIYRDANFENISKVFEDVRDLVL